MLLCRRPGEERRMRKRYPLEPLVTLRRDRVERRAVEAGDAERRAAAEKAALEAARTRRTAAEARAALESAAARSRLEAGTERAHDLTRAELHRLCERKRVEALGAAERRAERTSAAAERALSQARSALGEARAETRIIERHEARFRRGEEAKAHGAEEEAAADFHGVLSRKRKG